MKKIGYTITVSGLALLVACSSPADKQTTQTTSLINMRDYMFDEGLWGDSSVFCYSDSTGVIKKYAHIYVETNGMDSIILNADYDSSFTLKSIDRARITPEGQEEINLVMKNLKNINGDVEVVYDSSRIPWLQPIQHDSASSFAALSGHFSTSSYQMIMKGHLEEVPDTVPVKGYPPADCIRQIYSVVLSSGVTNANDHHQENSSAVYIYCKHKGLIYYTEPGFDSPDKVYFLQKRMRFADFEALRSAASQ